MRTFIFGASVFAKEVYWLIKEINSISEQKFLVQSFVVHDNDNEVRKEINGVEVISESIYFEKYHSLNFHNCIIAVGSTVLRKKIFNNINSKKLFFQT